MFMMIAFIFVFRIFEDHSNRNIGDNIIFRRMLIEVIHIVM